MNKEFNLLPFEFKKENEENEEIDDDKELINHLNFRNRVKEKFNHLNKQRRHERKNIRKMFQD